MCFKLKYYFKCLKFLQSTLYIKGQHGPVTGGRWFWMVQHFFCGLSLRICIKLLLKSFEVCLLFKHLPDLHEVQKITVQMFSCEALSFKPSFPTYSDFAGRFWQYLVHRIPDLQVSLFQALPEVFTGPASLHTELLVLLEDDKESHRISLIKQLPLTHQYGQMQSTLSMILPFSCVGEGSCSAMCSTGSVRSLSPNTSLKIRAIWRCCSMGQCSSMDRITGNLK